MTRLLKHVKKTIAETAAEQATADAIAANLDTEKSLCGKLFKRWSNENTTPVHQKVMRNIAPEVRSAFVRTESEALRFSIKATFKNGDGNPDYTYNSHRMETSRPAMIPAALHSSSLDIEIPNDSKLGQELSAWRAETFRIKQEAKALENEVMAVLSSCNTVAKLLKIWPESKELIPEDLLKPKEKVYLPAFNPAKLNNVIGLPSKTKKAA